MNNKVHIGNYEIDIFRFAVMATLALLLIVTPFWWFFGRQKPALDAHPNGASVYMSMFTYPFENDASRNEFARRSKYFASGEELLNLYPTVAKQYPAGFGRPVRMYVWFPDGELKSGAPYSYESGDYQYYRGIVIPENDPQTFNQLQQNYNNAVQSARQGADPINDFDPVMIGFHKNFLPPEDMQYAQIYALYYWGSARQNPDPSLVGWPSFLVGESKEVLLSQITAPANQIVPSDFTFARKDLTVTVSQVEYSNDSIRALVTVRNSASEPVDWAWDDGAFLTSDNQGLQVEIEDQQNPKPDRLPTEFKPSDVVTGYMFFPRSSFPQAALKLNIPLPGDDDARTEIGFDLSHAQKVSKDTGAIS